MNGSVPGFLNPKGFEIDFDLLQGFERGLDSIHPERSTVPCRVLGYGEISTVFEIQADTFDGLAFKRISIFEAPEELSDYLVTYQEYNRLLDEEVGIHLPPHGHAAFVNEDGRSIFYIIQGKMPAPAIGNKAIHLLPQRDALNLFQRVLGELHKVWKFNQRHTGLEIGIDGQVSNWVIDDFNASQPRLEPGARLAYVDTSTPFIRSNGIEQMDPELFLRSAPSFLAWILRALFLKDVVDRYYELRLVVIDLLANCCKEQMPELIPDLVVMANNFFAGEAESLEVEPIEEKEVFSYYREDSLIWSLYLSMRRVDRFFHRYILFRPYPYILPGRINR
jgi:hypothetical protein